MPTKRGHLSRDEKGFSLIELLLVILIIGILAAIAIPSFLNQRSKGYDAAAKTNLNTAQIAMEVYGVDHNGAFPATVDTSNGTSDPLAAVEPSLRNQPYVTGASDATGYTLTSQAVGPGSSGDSYTLTLSGGVVTRRCSGASGGCPNSSW